MAYAAYNAAEPVAPLLLSAKRSLLKLFLSDTGMLTTMYGPATKLKILTAAEDINKGAIYENVVAQELKAHGFNLFYYNSKKMGELDFLVEHNGSVLPIEVKSGKTYQRHRALSGLLSVPNCSFGDAIVFSGDNVSVKGAITYLPVYMVMFLENSADFPEL